MNTKTLLRAMFATAIVLASVNQVAARSWRINNDQTKMPDFIDINAACASADVVAGDTLYLDPGTNLTTDQTVSKRLTIIGCGYSGTVQPYGFATISGILYLRAANSELKSLLISGKLQVRANYLTIERCRLSGGIINSSASSVSNYTASSYTIEAQYATFRQCYITCLICGAGASDTKTAFWTIENCIFQRTFTSTSGSYHNCITNLYNANIRNNIILLSSPNTSSYCLAVIKNSRISNNIILHTSKPAQAFGTVDTDQLNNNVLSSNTRPEYNRCNVLNTDSVYTGSIQQYVLTEDSPAKGYGQDGKDCGIFGGLFPYVNGGLPYGHPYFEQYTVSSRPEDGKVNVSLKIMMKDE